MTLKNAYVTYGKQKAKKKKKKTDNGLVGYYYPSATFFRLTKFEEQGKKNSIKIIQCVAMTNVVRLQIKIKSTKKTCFRCQYPPLHVDFDCSTSIININHFFILFI